jgi:hypothetical protein
MSNNNLSKEEKEFDKWFDTLPLTKRTRLRKEGVVPYREVASTPNVFPIIESHPMWSDASQDKTRIESTRYIGEEELRERLVALFDILERFADGRMKLHLVFIKTMLGCDTGTTIAKLSKKYKITKQAMNWRARQLRSALGNLSKAPNTPISNLFEGGGTLGVAARPGVKK